MGEPSRIGRYRILGVLGRGAMGTVYLGHDETGGLQVAIKTLSPAPAANPEVLARFLREGQFLARLRHPNIVALHDLSEHEVVSYLAVELLQGLDLRCAVSRGISLKISIPVVVQVLAGLAYVHEQGIVHRDIKPSNIFIQTDGSVKITDFVLATNASEAPSGFVVGTPDYTSPEIVRGARLDGRSDLFAVGCMLYELVVGRAPFHTDNLMAIFYRITHQDPDLEQMPQGSQWQPLSGVIRRALRRNPADRYPEASAMSAELLKAFAQLGGEADWKTPPAVPAPILTGDRRRSGGPPRVPPRLP